MPFVKHSELPTSIHGQQRERSGGRAKISDGDLEASDRPTQTGAGQLRYSAAYATCHVTDRELESIRQTRLVRPPRLHRRYAPHRATRQPIASFEEAGYDSTLPALALHAGFAQRDLTLRRQIAGRGRRIPTRVQNVGLVRIRLHHLNHVGTCPENLNATCPFQANSTKP